MKCNHCRFEEIKANCPKGYFVAKEIHKGRGKDGQLDGTVMIEVMYVPQTPTGAIVDNKPVPPMQHAGVLYGDIEIVCACGTQS